MEQPAKTLAGRESRFEGESARANERLPCPSLRGEPQCADDGRRCALVGKVRGRRNGPPAPWATAGSSHSGRMEQNPRGPRKIPPRSGQLALSPHMQVLPLSLSADGGGEEPGW